VEQTIVGIDVGTTKVCTLVAHLDQDGQLQVIGVGLAPSRGMLKGIVTDIDEASEAIGESIQRAERVSGITIKEAYVSIGGNHIDSCSNRGIVAVGRAERPIDRNDVRRAKENAEAIPVLHGRRIIHCLPREYFIDDQRGIQNPLGLVGHRLEVHAHIVTGSESSTRNLIHCLGRRGVEVADLVLQPLASAQAVLTEEEKRMGVALVDIGGGTTDLAVYVDGVVWGTEVLPVGGNHITHDIAVGLRAPWGACEEIKIRYAHASPEMVDENDVVETAAFGPNSMRAVSRQYLCQIANMRVEEIFELVLRELRRESMDNFITAGVVVTGGTANLRGIAEVAAEGLGMPVRIGAPRRLRGLVEAIGGPAYATSVGLLLWAAEQHGDTVIRERTHELPTVQRMVNWLRRLLPRD